MSTAFKTVLGFMIIIAIPYGVKVNSTAAKQVSESTSYETYCKYDYSNMVISYCTNMKKEEARVDCEKRTSAKYKENIRCWCTDDVEYIGSRCTFQP